MKAWMLRGIEICGRLMDWGASFSENVQSCVNISEGFLLYL